MREKEPVTLLGDESRRPADKVLVAAGECRRRRRVKRTKHLIAVQRHFADEIALLSGGRIEKQGTREEIFPQLVGTEAAQDVCAKLK